MSAIVDLLNHHLDQTALQQVSARLGADQGTTSKAMAAAVPLLLGVLPEQQPQRRC